MWVVIMLDEVSDWFLQLAEEEGETADHVEAAINLLEQHGPTLGRPIADRLKGSSIHNLKELRPPATNIRILFAFDPQRQAILLVAGDKSRAWKGVVRREHANRRAALRCVACRRIRQGEQ